jgi:hypothetical protein
MRLIYVLTFLCVIQFTVFGQKSPIKYGKIDKVDLDMKVYAADTSAAAVILCDYGYFNSTQFQFVRTLRIKIYKKEGTSWGNQVFSINSKANIRGITYNLENGEIVESKLKSESIFEERVANNYYRTRVAMPNVKEGSVIDLEFIYSGLPNEWRFQQIIPVRWSELIIEPSQYFSFRKNFFGFERLSVGTDMRWVAQEMPAFKEEPYLNSTSNYITRFEIELLSVSLPSGNSMSTGVFREFSTTWEAINSLLSESPRFGNVIKGCAFLNTIAKDIEKNNTDSIERLKAAHESIKKAIKWNENESLFSTSESLNSLFTKKIGNSGDINLMLISLLKKLDFKVYPVALSTRNNGILSPFSPSLAKLNYVVAYVFLGGKTYLLDATEEFLPIGMLPERCINIKGRLIDDKNSQWVDLMTDKKYKKYIHYNMMLESDNLLSGEISMLNTDYAALDFRKKYEKFNSKEEYLKNLESNNSGLSIINCKLTNLDSIYHPVKEEYEVKIKNKVTSVGNLVYINPLLFEQVVSNPFKSEERKYPVDFIYPSEKTYLFTLNLPKGAQVVELPKTLALKLQDGSASIQYQATAMDGIVQISYKILLNKAVYSELEYSDLRALFSELVKKHAEQIVIKTI